MVLIMNFRAAMQQKYNGREAANRVSSSQAEKFKQIIRSEILSANFQAQCIISVLEKQISKKIEAGERSPISDYDPFSQDYFERRAGSFIEQLAYLDCQIDSSYIRKFYNNAFHASPPWDFNFSISPYYSMIGQLGLTLTYEYDDDGGREYKICPGPNDVAIIAKKESCEKTLLGSKYSTTFTITPYGRNFQQILFSWARKNGINLIFEYSLEASSNQKKVSFTPGVKNWVNSSENWAIRFDGINWNCHHLGTKKVSDREIQVNRVNDSVTVIDIKPQTENFGHHFKLTKIFYSMTL